MDTLKCQINFTMSNDHFISDIDNVNSDCCMLELEASSVFDENNYDLGDCNVPLQSLDFFSTEDSALKLLYSV